MYTSQLCSLPFTEILVAALVVAFTKYSPPVEGLTVKLQTTSPLSVRLFNGLNSRKDLKTLSVNSMFLWTILDWLTDTISSSFLVHWVLISMFVSMKLMLREQDKMSGVPV